MSGCAADCVRDARSLLIEGGATRKRRATPPIEKPINWVDITNNHRSVGKSKNQPPAAQVAREIITGKVPFLVIKDALDRNNIGRICTLGADARHYRYQHLLNKSQCHGEYQRLCALSNVIFTKQALSNSRVP